MIYRFINFINIKMGGNGITMKLDNKRSQIVKDIFVKLDGKPLYPEGSFKRFSWRPFTLVVSSLLKVFTG